MTCSQLLHDLFMTCSWLVQDLLRAKLMAYTIQHTAYTQNNSFSQINNLFMTCSRLVDAFFMICSRLVHDLSVNHSWLVHNLIVTHHWLVQHLFKLGKDLYMTCSQLDYNVFIICSWGVHHFFMSCICLVITCSWLYNLFMTWTLFVCHLYMTSSWLMTQNPSSARYNLNCRRVSNEYNFVQATKSMSVDHSAINLVYNILQILVENKVVFVKDYINSLNV